MTPLQNAKLLVSIPDIWARLGLPGTPGKSCRSPFREDRAPSFSIFADGFRWKDHGTAESGDSVDFLAKALCIQNSDACKALIEMAGIATHNLPLQVRQTTRTHATVAMKTKPSLCPIEIPELSEGTSEEKSALTCIRKLHSSDGVELAVKRGVLGFTSLFDRNANTRAWVIRDAKSANAQARRLDGLPWQELPGTPKARSAKGSCAGWPIGATDAATRPFVILSEGGPDMLAALTGIATRAKYPEKIAAVAITGAGQRIHPEALTLLRGKRVRIVPHLDKAGASAAIRWDSELTAVGASVEWFDLRPFVPPGGKDLNDAISHDPEALAPLVRFAGEETEVAA